MKIACSSASFAREIAAGTLTQLDWLDVCANELEVDGVVFDAAHFPRTDAEYCAQLKKASVDLGLTVAGLADRTIFSADDASVAATVGIAGAVGAPLVIAPTTPREASADAWGTLVGRAAKAARVAKRDNVTLAVRSMAGTLCASATDLKRLAKDVDSAWLRFAFNPNDAERYGDESQLLAKSVVAWHDVSDVARFAEPEDSEARTVAARLARFRGFVVLHADTASHHRESYHELIARFTKLRSSALDAFES